MQFLRSLYDRFLNAVSEVENESQASQAEAAPGLDWRVIGVITVACVCVSILEYYGGSGDYRHWEKPLGLIMEKPNVFLHEIFRRGDLAELYRLAYWALSTFFWYFLVPATFVKFGLKGKLTDYGMSLKGTLSHAWIYLVLYLAVLPFVVIVAFTPEFQKTYPFYSGAGASVGNLVRWEFLYALQFLSLEFFYRGFLIHALKPRFGFYAVFVSVIPYCMIHFGKPLPETLGAVIAGIALGTLSLFTRNIWGGVAIHVGVAVTMDVLSLFLQGKFWFQL